jgi:DnaJ family protein B protein 4
LEFHPDRPNGNAIKFKEINEAYETLADNQKRKQYDQAQNMPDLFEMLFKDSFAPSFMFQMKPPPLVISVEITLDQAFTGCKLPLSIERWVIVQNMKQLERETIYIDIPCGIDTNECLFIPNKGNMGGDGCLGDIRVMVIVVNTTKMERKGLDLLYTHTITLKEALCGFSGVMEYLHGQMIQISNNAGNVISPSFKKIISEMGMKRDAQRGNLIITFNIVFPSLTMDKIESLSALL